MAFCLIVKQLSATKMILMFEMTFSSEDHGDAKLVAFLDGILVADGSARLHDGFHAVLGRQGHAVIEREESVGSQNETCLAGSLLRVSSSAKVAAACFRASSAEPTRFIWPAPTP